MFTPSKIVQHPAGFDIWVSPEVPVPTYKEFCRFTYAEIVSLYSYVRHTVNKYKSSWGTNYSPIRSVFFNGDMVRTMRGIYDSWTMRNKDSSFQTHFFSQDRILYKEFLYFSVLVPLNIMPLKVNEYFWGEVAKWRLNLGK